MAWCPEGKHYPEKVARTAGWGGYSDDVPQPGVSAEVNCFLGYWVQRRRILETDEIEEMLMKMSPRNIGLAPFEWPGPMDVADDEEKLTKEVRGTTIIVSNFEWVETFLAGYHYFRQLDKTTDLIVIDTGIRDWSTIFHYDPDLLRNARWRCNKCKSTQKYVDFSWMKWCTEHNAPVIKNEKGKFECTVGGEEPSDTNDKDYPPLCKTPGCNGHMVPRGDPIINYVYVGGDIDNLAYYVLQTIGGELGGVEVE
jgi:hypothetical protein